MSKYLAFDIEIAALFPEDVIDWKAYRPLGITCAAFAWQQDGEIKTMAVCGGDGSPTPRMDRGECQRLVNRLQKAVQKGYTILTHNGLSFDFDILAEESGLHSECCDLAMNHVDTMFHFFCIQGFPVGLDALAKGMGSVGKIEGMNGAKAPYMWAERKYDQVLAYVAQDAKTTLEVALAVERRNSIRWITKSGNAKATRLPGGWLPVCDALTLPEPDTSWMRSPLPRSHFTEWMR